jgi:hypothetical protein
MKRNAHEFIRSTTTLLDHILATLTQEEQHDVLDALASYAGSDYPWRILCPAADLPRFMSALTTSIDYGNFKSAIAASPTQRPKLAAYHDIHHRMVEWQQEHTEALENDSP